MLIKKDVVHCTQRVSGFYCTWRNAWFYTSWVECDNMNIHAPKKRC